MTAPGSVAILGGGIMGCCLALEFARRGVRSVLFEMEDQLLSGASRWNEGKIHLGYLYSADPSLTTARKVLPGGLAFKALLEELIGMSVRDVVTRSDDIFLCHESSVVTSAKMAVYFQRVTELVREHASAANYLADLRSARAEQLSAMELAAITQSDSILAGFRVPERSVSTNWVADRLEEAVLATRMIELRTGTRVTGVVDASAAATKDRWRVATPAGEEGPFDCVVNALWHGRLAVDATTSLPLPREWSHRYRMSVFLRTRVPLYLPSTIIATGPFGDIKNYNGRDFYLSWYPRGLMRESTAVLPEAPPPLSANEAGAFAVSVLSELSEFIPGVRDLSGEVERMEVRGGWVFAAATGLLSDPQATLHSRTDFGISHTGTYLSVDTGKYSTAPWLARKLCEEMLGQA